MIRFEIFNIGLPFIGEAASYSVALENLGPNSFAGVNQKHGNGCLAVPVVTKDNCNV